jgi:hypothetical protein
VAVTVGPGTVLVSVTVGPTTVRVTVAVDSLEQPAPSPMRAALPMAPRMMVTDFRTAFS